MSDAESWMELCELYIAEQELAKAAFCCEELILQNPNNHIYFQRYAEVKFTQGGFENMGRAARAVSLAETAASARLINVDNDTLCARAARLTAEGRKWGNDSADVEALLTGSGKGPDGGAPVRLLQQFATSASGRGHAVGSRLGSTS